MADHKKNVNSDPAERRRKYLSMGLSLILAIVLWFYASNTDNRDITKNYTVPVEILNTTVLESSGLVISDPGQTEVKVTIEGRRSVIASVKVEDIVATIDASSLEEGEHYVDITVHAPASISVVRINPSQLRLNVEPLVTVNKEVKVVFNGSSSLDEEAVCTDISTEIVEVSGSRSAVAKVACLQAAIDTYKLSSREKSFVASLVPVDENGQRVEDVTIALQTVSVTACLYEVKTVALKVITVGELPEPLELASIDAPDEVTVAGPSDEIEQLAEITTNAVDLSVINASTEVELIPDIPGKVRLAASEKTITAVITVRKLTNRVFTYTNDDIEMRNVVPGSSAQLVSQSVSIEVIGTENALDTLSSADFTLSADCSDLSDGIHEVKLEMVMSDRAQQYDLTVPECYAEIKIG